MIKICRLFSTLIIGLVPKSSCQVAQEGKVHGEGCDKPDARGTKGSVFNFTYIYFVYYHYTTCGCPLIIGGDN